MVSISSSPMSILWVLMLVAAANSALGYIITMPGCNETCQNSDLLIPYPFGIGRNCYHNHSAHYEVVCKPSNSSPGAFIPFLKKLNIRVFNISFLFDVNDNYNNWIISKTMYNIEVASDRQELCPGRKSKYPNDLRGSPFSFLVDDNQIVVEGCPAHLNIKDDMGNVMSGCSAFCKDDADTTWVDDACGGCTNGLGGCLTKLAPYGYMEYYEIEMSNMSNVLVRRNNSNTCLNVTLMKIYSNRSSISDHSAIWMWNAPPIFEVSSREFCDLYNINSGAGFLCFCKHGYKGHPYLPYGCRKLAPQRKFVILGLGISLGSITFLICCYGLFHVIRRWIRIKRKAKFFKRNGGLLLQQQVTTEDGRVARTKVFTVDELDKATDSFNGNRILGRGGQGTVYKGMLLDGSVVAIKKSLKVDESQIEQFINEVVILSQINHRNVVKLLGCCLETEVPLLVYEFIQNGTLGQHIHNRDEDFHITWTMRLQIAAESAGAVAYLHSASTTPIYHRDIKSANILLDGKYRAKVADFGTSRTVLIDQTHLTTLVQGTLGYLDPEYFQTNQYTEKSDVYSFGVVLVELLTGQKPLSSTQSGGWKSLTNDFLLHMETSRLFDIIDSQILSEAKEEELLAMASLARRCLNLNGRQRPTMKEVSSVLEGIRSSTLPPSAVYHSEFNEYDEIIELGETPEGHVTHVVTNTFCSENIVIGDSSSIEVKPLMHYTI